MAAKAIGHAVAAFSPMVPQKPHPVFSVGRIVRFVILVSVLLFA
jgi:hypothetical protein